MLIHIKSGKTFANRKEAKMVMGAGRYNRLAAHNEFYYINDIDLKRD